MFLVLLFDLLRLQVTILFLQIYIAKHAYISSTSSHKILLAWTMHTRLPPEAAKIWFGKLLYEAAQQEAFRDLDLFCNIDWRNGALRALLWRSDLLVVDLW